jgi:DNA invertase Pin-like site-specific DNA recombinase
MAENDSLRFATQTPKRFALYVRVSTNRHKCRSCNRLFPMEDHIPSPICPKCGSGDIEQGQKPDTQLLPLRAYARAHGGVEAEEYVDQGYSGAKTSRPELDRLMTDAKRRKFDAVVVVRFDRFARSVPHLIMALEEFQTCGVHFVSLSEAIDTSTPMGRMVFVVVGAVAELERALTIERIHAGLDRARRHNKRLGRPVRIVDRDRVCALYKTYRSVRKVARMTGVSKDKVASIVSLDANATAKTEEILRLYAACEPLAKIAQKVDLEKNRVAAILSGHNEAALAQGLATLTV